MKKQKIEESSNLSSSVAGGPRKATPGGKQSQTTKPKSNGKNTGLNEDKGSDNGNLIQKNVVKKSTGRVIAKAPEDPLKLAAIEVKEAKRILKDKRKTYKEIRDAQWWRTEPELTSGDEI